ncbi:MAG TPA: hypothetical protein VIF82_03560 [Burkholderiaceae bacterium]|jgi:hypothetical protein
MVNTIHISRIGKQAIVATLNGMTLKKFSRKFKLPCFRQGCQQNSNAIHDYFANIFSLLKKPCSFTACTFFHEQNKHHVDYAIH